MGVVKAGSSKVLKDYIAKHDATISEVMSATGLSYQEIATLAVNGQCEITNSIPAKVRPTKWPKQEGNINGQGKVG